MRYPLWSAPRIHGELLKLGIDVAQSTVAKYMAKRGARAVADLEDLPPWTYASTQRLHSHPGNRHAERLIGSIRRECLDHIIVFGEGHLRRILAAYTAHYNELRTHLSLDKDSPANRPIQRLGQITRRPILGGLHHGYCRI